MNRLDWKQIMIDDQLKKDQATNTINNYYINSYDYSCCIFYIINMWVTIN